MASSSESATSASTMATAVQVAPLALSTVRDRYPRLFAMYASLSEREEQGTDQHLLPATDPSTGLYTKIFFQNFAENLHRNPDDVPLKTESDGNKYFHFVYRMLLACESGSCGGDACRLYEILYAALDGAMEYSASNDSILFDHLLGWTAAANNHGLHQLWDRAMPCRTQHLFDMAAGEWKKLFEKTQVSGAIPGVSDEMRNFAIGICDEFKKVVVGARKEWGDHAKYSFNFIKPKNRPAKKPVEKKLKKVVEKKAIEATKETNESSTKDSPLYCFIGTDIINCDDMRAAGAAAKSAMVTPTASCFSTKPEEGAGYYDNDTAVTITIKKRSQLTKLGLTLAKVDGPGQCSSMKVTAISESSLFRNTELRTGMIIFMVNGTVYTKFDHGVKMLQSAKRGNVTIIAAFPHQGDGSGDDGFGVDSTMASAVVDAPGRKCPMAADDFYSTGERKVGKKTSDDGAASVNQGDPVSTKSVNESLTIDDGSMRGESEFSDTLSGMKRKAVS